MKILDKNGLSGFMEIFVLVIFFIECAGAAFLPWILRFLLETYSRFGQGSVDYYAEMLVLIYFTFLFGLPFTWQIKGILRNINRKTPFIADNARRLRRLSGLSAVLSAGYFAAIFFVPSFFVPLMFLLFALMSLFLAVCAELFAQAVRFREENELTI